MPLLAQNLHSTRRVVVAGGPDDQKERYRCENLLERAKGSALDVRSTRLDCAETLALLSRHTQQFRTLNFFDDYGSNIRMFSEAMPGPRAFELEILGPETTNPPPSPPPLQ